MKIYVTGLGVISGIGIGVSENIEALKQKRHGIGKVTLFPTALDVPVSEVKCDNEKLKQLLSLSPLQTVSRTALLGMMAAKEALEDAGLPDAGHTEYPTAATAAHRVYIRYVGRWHGSQRTFLRGFQADPSRGQLREVISHDCGASTELIASYLGIRDFVTTISTACSSAANAVMLGARMIQTRSAGRCHSGRHGRPLPVHSEWIPFADDFGQGSLPPFRPFPCRIESR